MDPTDPDPQHCCALTHTWMNILDGLPVVVEYVHSHHSLKHANSSNQSLQSDKFRTKFEYLAATDRKR